MLTSDELELGYWGSRRVNGLLPARSIIHPDELTNAEVLSLACTQTSLPSAEQRKLVNSWCALLPDLQLKTLIFESKVTQSLFDAAVQIKGLEALYIKWSGIKSIASIADCKSLTALEVGSSPSLTGLHYLTQLPKLRILRIENIREANDLRFASDLMGLEELGIAGSMWSDQKIDSLWPLKDLKNLEFLWLIGARVLRDGLLPLHGMIRLTTLKCSFTFRASEFSALRAATPSLRFGSPFEDDLIALYCKA